jgi:hypothetical protein
MRESQYRVWDQRHPIVVGRNSEGNEYGANLHSVGVVGAISAEDAIQRAKAKGLAKDPIVRRINGS